MQVLAGDELFDGIAQVGDCAVVDGAHLRECGDGIVDPARAMNGG